MTTATLSKSTDTPKASKAPKTSAPNTQAVTTQGKASKAPAAPSAAESAALDVAAFVTAYVADSVSVATKARIIGRAIMSGTETVTIISNRLIAGLEAQSLIIPKSFPASVSHYATAYNSAAKVMLSSDDAALSAAYQISTGVVKSKVRAAFLESFTGDSAAFVAGCRELVKSARSAKKVAPVKTDQDGEPTLTAESELETISPLDDARALLKQYRAILDLLSDNAPDDYTDAVDLLLEFSASYDMTGF